MQMAIYPWMCSSAASDLRFDTLLDDEFASDVACDQDVEQPDIDTVAERVALLVAKGSEVSFGTESYVVK